MDVLYMQPTQNEFETILSGLVDVLRTLGTSEQTIWRSYYQIFCSVRKFHHQKGLRFYDDKTLSEYEIAAKARYHNGEISRNYHNVILKCVDRMREYVTTGDLQWSRRPIHSHTSLNEKHEVILREFMASLAVAPTTFGDVSWTIRKYLSFMERSQRCFAEITIDDLRKFYIFCSKTLTKNSMRNIQCYVRKFHKYLEQKDYSHLSGAAILNSAIAPEKKILPALTWNEYYDILVQIDIHTSQGKRDYAIFVLAATSGLRGVDIVNLRLKDIDWANGIINVLQQKTHQTLSLPLTKVAGEAIKSYILNGRPDCDSEYIFITARPPIQKLKDSMALNYLIRHYQKKTGISHFAYDGKGFHSIRRMIGTSMVLSGVTTDLTAQTLGHQNLKTIQQYISLDSVNLKECAISFGNIMPLPGRWR